MKNILIAGVLFIILIGNAIAQPNPPSVDKQVLHLKRILQLDDKQTDKIKSIVSSSDAKLNDLRDKLELAHQKQVAEMKKAHQKDIEEVDNLMTDRDNQISQILNDTQKKKFDDFRDEQQMRRPDDGFPPPSMKGKDNMPGPQGCCQPHMDNLPDDPNGPPAK